MSAGRPFLRGGRLVAAVSALGASLAATPARASIFDTYGLGSRGVGMGSALTAASADYLATYYNPADLLANKRLYAGIGAVALVPNLSIDRDLEHSPFETVLPDNNVGVTLGLSAPLGGVFRQKLAAGFCLFLPLLRFTRAQFDDPGKPQMYMHDNLSDKLLLAVGVAGEPAEWVRLGVGFQLLANLGGTADFDMALVDGRIERESLSIDLNADLAVTAGLTMLPAPGVALAVTYRQELDFQFQLPVRAKIAEFGLLTFDLSGTSLYTPHQVAFGASWKLPEAWGTGLTLAADATLALWALAPSPAPRVAFSIGGENLLGANAPAGPVISATSEPIHIEPVNVVIPRFGAEVALGQFHVRAGYAYRPTPLPRPVASANYVDSDSHVVSLGADWSLPNAADPGKPRLTLGVGAAALLMEPRRVDKVDPDDATGGYWARGQVFHVSVDLQHAF